MNYRNINNLVGLATGIIATIVYLMTMEPTVSFWDCGEFISCGYKIEVGHSPGAPVFMLIQRMFGLLAGGNLAKVALMINAWSAIASGGTILFLFWTITHFAKNLLVTNREAPSGNQTVLIMGAGLVGALAYTFSDTFWFSAVEAEVYATSSLFTAAVFWAMLKWEERADEPHADRWLVLIAYLMGLSIGIHLLNLLTIPALAILYYYKRYQTTTIGSISAFLIGCAILALIQFGVIQGIPYLAFKADLLFVNSFHLPFDSGALFFLVALTAATIYLLIWAKKKGKYLLHLGTLSLLFVFIGFLSYMVPVIRSRADVPIDMTNPDNANRFLSYVNREQFGQQPLMFGPDFDSPYESSEIKGYHYDNVSKNGKDSYEIVGKKLEYKFGKERFFPRIWDNNDPNHINFYRSYLDLPGDESPSSADNFKFFFSYQLNWMWWRYFMWNYAGRQNDFEGQGGPKDGNWISGISFIDKGRVGDIDKMQDGYRNNRARNQYYFLPLILGMMGVVYQFNQRRKDGIVTLMLFFFTGIAIVLFLNNTPLQPRERDYAYAGSTYAFAIWIGLGVMMLHDYINRFLKGAGASYIAIGASLLAVPFLMARENWDDHDRSKKSLARAIAVNTLQSCAPNAILFTFGDNDTYPLWYLQEVEGIRTDVRIINTSLLGIDWYVDQLNYKTNDADAVPMIWKKEHYIGDRRNYLTYFENPQIPKDKFFNLEEIVNFIISNDPKNLLQNQAGETVNYLPSKNFFVSVPSKEVLIQNGVMSPSDTGITPEMRFTYDRNAATKDDLAVLNIVAAVAKDGWKRPIYFGSGMGDKYQGMDDFLKLEGTVFRLVPFKRASAARNQGDMGFVDLNKSHQLFTTLYQYGGGERKDVYFDEKNRQMFTTYRVNGARVADELSAAGRTKEAVEVLDHVMKGISEAAYPYDIPTYFMAMSYYKAGAKEKGRDLSLKLARNSEDDIKYILSFQNEDTRQSFASDVQRDLTIINILSNVSGQGGDQKTSSDLNTKFNTLVKMVEGKIRFEGR